MRIILSLFLTIFSLSSYAQNSAVTDFKENHETALSLYFYPSTLRMVNIEQNPEFNEMIRQVKKARFFRMDSGTVSKDDLNNLVSELTEDGFEEVMFVKNKNMDLKVWGLETKNPELVIISKSDEELMLLEINGMINIAKIPKLAETFNQNSFLDILKLNKKNN